MIKKILDNQIIRFLIVGGMAFVTEYLIFYVLVTLLKDVPFIYNIAQTFSMICGAIVSFVINKLWAFQAKENTIKQSIKYIIVFLFNMGVTNVLISLITNYHLIDNLLIIKLLLVGLTTTWNFFLYKYFVYKK